MVPKCEINASNWTNVSKSGLRVAAIIFGIVLAVTPLALWIAWSTMAFLLIIVIGIISLVGFLLCHWLSDEELKIAEEIIEHPPWTGAPPVGDAVLSVLSGLGPFIYHNRLSAEYRFALKMAQLQKLLEREQILVANARLPKTLPASECRQSSCSK